MVTIEKLLKDGIDIIKKRDYNNPNLDVQLILSHLLSKDRIYLQSAMIVRRNSMKCREKEMRDILFNI